ncbi:DUF4129 domain-containing protein [Streptomyces sp. NPDC006670]|uniref:DUF4129 domain-containing protein n=1 Tax=Streptomyces sp. NPDC006670 TaxID=3154476 RepID=UPI0033E71871
MGREGTGDGPRGRGGTGAAPAALSVLAVGGTALAALLLHPAAGLFAKGRGPLGGNPVLVLGLALLSLLGGFALRGRYLERLGDREALGPVEQRLADGTGRLLLAVPLALPVLIVTLHRFGPPARGGAADGREPSPFPAPQRDPVPTPAPTGAAAPAVHDTDSGLTRTLLGAGAVLLAVALVLAALWLRRYLTRAAGPGAPTGYVPPDGDGDGDGHLERLAEAVDSGRRALLLDGADARAAVIGCYRAMEESLAGSGVARHASDSPQELLERALAGGLPAATAATELTALFREARYSTHPMDAGHRDRAGAALAAIARALRPEPPAAGAVAT